MMPWFVNLEFRPQSYHIKTLEESATEYRSRLLTENEATQQVSSLQKQSPLISWQIRENASGDYRYIVVSAADYQKVLSIATEIPKEEAKEGDGCRLS